MNLAASSFNAASASQVKLKDAYLGGLKEKQRGDLSHEREENQEKLTIVNLNHGIFSLFLKITKLVGNHLQEDQQNSCLQNFRKVKIIKERLWNTSLPYRQITSLTWMTYPMKDLDVNMAIMENIYECHSQSSNSSRKWQWREFEKGTKFFLDNYRTTFRGKKKSWSVVRQRL